MDCFGGKPKTKSGNHSKSGPPILRGLCSHSDPFVAIAFGLGGAGVAFGRREQHLQLSREPPRADAQGAAEDCRTDRRDEGCPLLVQSLFLVGCVVVPGFFISLARGQLEKQVHTCMSFEGTLSSVVKVEPDGTSPILFLFRGQS